MKLRINYRYLLQAEYVDTMKMWIGKNRAKRQGRLAEFNSKEKIKCGEKKLLCDKKKDFFLLICTLCVCVYKFFMLYVKVTLTHICENFITLRKKFIK